MRRTIRNLVKCDTTSPANPVLIYTAATLLTILAICHVDRHSEWSTKIGTAINHSGLDTPLIGP